MMKDLKTTRNFKGGFKKGLIPGLLHGFLTTEIFKGNEPWEIRNKVPDTAKTEPAEKHSVFSFDLEN